MKKYFLPGLVLLLPIAITIWLAHFILTFLTKPFVGGMSALLHRLPVNPLLATESRIHLLAQCLILIALFVCTLFIGFVARKYFFRHVLSLADRFLHKIPLVNKVYKTSKEIVQSLFMPNKNAFKQVVMIPFPYKGSYCIGLVSNDAPKTCSEAQETELVSVFVPTTPNPTTGFLILCPRSELIHLEMRSEEAIKYIVSCAVIQPEKRDPA